MSDPTLDGVQPYYGVYLREVGSPLVKTASRIVTPIESQRDTHNPIESTGGLLTERSRPLCEVLV